MKTILACDDDPAMHAVYEELLTEDDGYNLVLATTGIEALEKMNEQEINLLITDTKMPDMHGIELVKQIRKTDQELPIIVCTAFQHLEEDYKMIDANLSAYVMKPFTNEEFKQLIADTISQNTK